MGCCKKKKTFTFRHAVINRLKGTFNKVPPADRYERIAACRTCSHLFRPLALCSLCGCFIYEKTWHSESECPEGNWLSLEPEDPPFEDEEVD